MLARVAMPAVRQKRSKLAPTSCHASSTMATGTTAADVVESFMALLLLGGFSAPSLLAQGEQRLPSYFNIDRDIPAFAAGAEAAATGRLAVCAGSCGPGNLHLINGLYDCQRNRVPVLAIAAQIPSPEIGSGYFQETHPQQLFQECRHY